MGNTPNIITTSIDAGETLTQFKDRTFLDGTIGDVFDHLKSNRGSPTVADTKAGAFVAEENNLLHDIITDYIERSGSPSTGDIANVLGAGELITEGLSMQWQDNQGSPVTRAREDFLTDSWRRRYFNAAGALVTTLAVLTTTGAMSYDGDIAMTKPAAVFDQGDGTSAPSHILDGSGASGGSIDFQQVGIQRYQMRYFPASGDLGFQRYNGGGVAQDFPLILKQNGTAEFSNSVTIADANPVFTVGNSTGFVNARLLADGTSDTQWRITHAGADTGEVRMSAIEDLYLAYKGTPGGGDVAALQYDKSTHKWHFLDGVTARWNLDLATGDVVLPTGDLTLLAATPNVTFGNGTGAPNFIIDKAVGGTGEFKWQAANNNEWVWSHEPTTGDLFTKRYIAGVFQDNAVTLANATGLFTVANSAQVNGDLTVGEDTDSATIVQLLSTIVGTTAVNFGDPDDVDAGAVTYNHVDNRLVMRTAGANKFEFTATRASPVVDEGISIGTATKRVDGVHTNLYSLRSIAGFVGEEMQWQTGHVSTTDGSNNDTTIATLDTDQESVKVRMFVSGHRDTGDNFRTRIIETVIKRTASANAPIGAAHLVDQSGSDGTGSTAAITLQTGGTSIVIRVSGNVAEDWEWTLSWQVQNGGLTS